MARGPKATATGSPQPSEPKSAPPSKRLKVTLKQGPPLEGPGLVAALKRLVEIGRRLEREERANGRKSISKTRTPDSHRD